MWPKSFWEKFYEPAIRRAAGPRPRRREAGPGQATNVLTRSANVLVIGSGPPASWRRWRPARAGARVILADEGFRHGGSAARSSGEEIDGAGPDSNGRMRVTAELASMPNVTLMPRTTVFGWYDGNIFGAVERVNDHVAGPPTV